MRALAVTAVCALSFAVGFVAAIMTPAAANPPPSPPTEARSNMDFLGSFETVIDPNDPIVAQLVEDDRIHGRK